MPDHVRDPGRRGFLTGTGQAVVLGGAGLLAASAARAMPIADAPASTTALAAEKTDEAVAVATINALEGAYGVHPRQRRNHAKGVGCLGHFTGNPMLKAWSRSPLFSGERMPVVARFSIAGGDPQVKDADRSTRGLGIEFRPKDGALHHMTMLNTPMFFARVPQTFLDKFVALAVDPHSGHSDPALLRAFVASHPDSHDQMAFLAGNNPPRSYAEEAYFGIHSFFLADSAGRRTMIKFHFQPRDGIHRLTEAEMGAMPADFLAAALADRFRHGAAEWDLVITLGEPGDEERDPTVQWPPGRRQIQAGVLRLTDAVPSDQAGSFRINYDPLMLTDGFEPSADPVLLFRSPSYAVSHGRRLRNL